MHNLKCNLVIAIGGGSGSGKSFLASGLQKYFGQEKSTVLPMDDYYKDLSTLKTGQRSGINFDLPDAFDLELFTGHLIQLREGKSISKPKYLFTEHIWNGEEIISAKEIIIVEGLFALFLEQIRMLADLKIFVDAPDEIRLCRRLVRDTKERSRTKDHVLKQYLKHVRPAYSRFIEPTKNYADFIVSGVEMSKNEIIRLAEQINFRSRK